MEGKKLKFEFVDNIRFYAILSIVIFHSCLVFVEFNKAEMNYSTFHQNIITIFMQFLRFGNVCFFLISGFLFGHSMSKSKDINLDVSNYVRRRWEVLKVPTLFFSFLLALIAILIPIAIQHIKDVTYDILELAKGFVKGFFMSYTWFIYNLFVAFLLIVLFAKFKWMTYPVYLFSLFLAIFWSLNPYFRWVEIFEHTQTFLGFSIYILWGFYLGQNINKFNQILEFINMNKILYIIFLVIVFCISFGESKLIYKFTDAMPYYNLRISSQLQSVTIFFGMCAFFTKPMYPKFANPKVETVGIYYMHSLVTNILYFGSFGILIFVFDIKGKENIPQEFLLPLLIVGSLFNYTFSLLLVKLLSKSKYSYLIGIK